MNFFLEVLSTFIGQYHGERSGGKAFDDAEDFSLTFNDRITAITGGGTKSEISYISFVYSNGRSLKRGDKPTPYEEYQLKLEMNEYIDRITIYNATRKIVNLYKPNATHLVVGLRFYTNRRRASELFGSANGHETNESFEDYHLGYVRGRAYGYIDALQFIWYKEKSRTDPALLPSD